MDVKTADEVVRQKQRELSEKEAAAVKAIKDLGAGWLQLLDQLGSSRELSIARTRVEEAVMWGVKHVTR